MNVEKLMIKVEGETRAGKTTLIRHIKKMLLEIDCYHSPKFSSRDHTITILYDKTKG